MALALDEPKETDHTHEANGITYLVDQELAKQVGEVNVDFVDKGWRAGFVISTKNPLDSGLNACGGGCSC